MRPDPTRHDQTRPTRRDRTRHDQPRPDRPDGTGLTATWRGLTRRDQHEETKTMSDMKTRLAAIRALEDRCTMILNGTIKRLRTNIGSTWPAFLSRVFAWS